MLDLHFKYRKTSRISLGTEWITRKTETRNEKDDDDGYVEPRRDFHRSGRNIQRYSKE